MKDIEQKLIDKIRNLLNMTVERGCSESEAANAVHLASKLMEQHSLTMNEITEESRSDMSETEADPNVPLGTAQLWTENVALMLSRYFGVYAIKKIKTTGAVTYVFFGLSVDVTIASEVFVWVCDQGKRLARLRADEQGDRSMGFRASYLVGFAKGIVSQVETAIRDREKAESDDASQGTGKYGAIVRHHAEEAQKYATDKYTVRKGRVRKLSVRDMAAAQAGYKDGINIPIQKGKVLV